MTLSIPSTEKQLATILEAGEGSTLEFKRSTGELREGMQTLCAFLNSSGGAVLFGVRRCRGFGKEITRERMPRRR